MSISLQRKLIAECERRGKHELAAYYRSKEFPGTKTLYQHLAAECNAALAEITTQYSPLSTDQVREHARSYNAIIGCYSIPGHDRRCYHPSMINFIRACTSYPEEQEFYTPQHFLWYDHPRIRVFATEWNGIIPPINGIGVWESRL